jgi:demethylmenaquinone methyltransferase/2-methoxy-6-polyprenyl-1,4-benzoquinol methylase
MAPGDLPYFDRVAPVYDLFMPAADAETFAAALDRADRPIERVLDVGGGTGRAVRAIDAPRRVVLDASAEMLARVPEGIATVRGDAREPPFRPESVDAALIVDAFHHLPDGQRVLEAVATLLRPGGVLVVAEFDPSTLRGRALEVGEHLIGMESRFYTPTDLIRALSDAGLGTTIVASGFGYTVAATKPGG